MLVWVLTFWTSAFAPFEGGQYVTETRCYKAAAYQMRMYKQPKLKYKCELKRV